MFHILQISPLDNNIIVICIHYQKGGGFSMIILISYVVVGVKNIEFIII